MRTTLKRWDGRESETEKYTKSSVSQHKLRFETCIILKSDLSGIEYALLVLLTTEVKFDLLIQSVKWDCKLWPPSQCSVLVLQPFSVYNKNIYHCKH